MLFNPRYYHGYMNIGEKLNKFIHSNVHILICMYAYKHIHFHVYLAIIIKEIINCEGLGKHGGESEWKKYCCYNCSCVKLKKKLLRRRKQYI